MKKEEGRMTDKGGRQRTKALIMALAGTLALTALGQLTATVNPGYQYADGERPTTDTLNQLGQPTISIAGTVAGTVGLAPLTVSGWHLMTADIDQLTLMWITNGGAWGRQMYVDATNLFGPGLTCTNDVLSVLADGTTTSVYPNGIGPNSGKVYVLTAGLVDNVTMTGTAGTGRQLGTLRVITLGQTWTGSGDTITASGGAQTVAAVNVRVWLRCTGNDTPNSLTVGDMVEIESVVFAGFTGSSSTANERACVQLVHSGFLGGTGNTVILRIPSGSGYIYGPNGWLALDPTKWVVDIYRQQ